MLEGSAKPWAQASGKIRVNVKALVPPSCVWKVENLVIWESNHGFLTYLILDILFNFSEPHFCHMSSGPIFIFCAEHSYFKTGQIQWVPHRGRRRNIGRPHPLHPFLCPCCKSIVSVLISAHVNSAGLLSRNLSLLSTLYTQVSSTRKVHFQAGKDKGPSRNQLDQICVSFPALLSQCAIGGEGGCGGGGAAGGASARETDCPTVLEARCLRSRSQQLSSSGRWPSLAFLA